MRWARALVIVATLTLGEHPRPADACTPPLEGIFRREVVPEDGAIGVPRNARVLVFYEGAWVEPPGDLELRVAGGATVATATATRYGGPFVLAAQGLLEPSTTYEVVDTLVVPCEGSDWSTCVGEPAVVATFTTGTQVDATPPTINGVFVTHGAACPIDSCEEATKPVIDRIAVGPIADDSSTAWVLYEYVGEDGMVVAGPTRITNAGRECSGGYFNVWEEYIEVEPSSYTFRAVDVAANVEVDGHAIEGATCALFEERCRQEADAGPPDASSGGGGGCSTSGGGGLGLGLLAVTLRRRGRGRKRGGSGRASAPTA